MSILYNRALLLAKVESTFRTDGIAGDLASALANNAFLVEDPQFNANVTSLQRDNVKSDLSPSAAIVGRKTAQITFVHEVRSNGNANGTVAPRLGTFLRGCGMAETQYANAAACIETPVAGSGNTGTITGGTGGFTKGGTIAAAVVAEMPYRLTCVTAGASATAKIRVTGGRDGHDQPRTREVFLGSVSRASGTPTMTLTPNAVDPLSVTYTVGGTFQVGDILKATICGIEVSYTVVSGDTDNDGAAASLSAAIDAAGTLYSGLGTGWGFSSANVDDVNTVTFTGILAGVVVTSTVTAITLRAGQVSSGGTLTIGTIGTNLALGDYWTTNVHPLGYEYTPVSTGAESLTLYLYYDGLLHKLTGSRGTWSAQGNGGEYAKYTFTFTGDYVAPEDVVIPTTAVYETTVPQQVELADLYLKDSSGAYLQTLCAASFNIDMGNEVVIRECINAGNSYEGALITSRQPSGGFNPEMVLEATHPFWANLASAASLEWGVRVGSTKGNITRFVAPNAQYTNIQYANRNSVRVYDASLNFARVNGNDEIKVGFC